MSKSTRIAAYIAWKKNLLGNTTSRPQESGWIDLNAARKYGKCLAVILTYYVVILVMVVYAASVGAFNHGAPALTPLIPVNNLYAQVALIFLAFAPTSAIIGGLAGGYSFAPVFLLMHKKIFGSRLLYGIQRRREPEAFDKVTRAYYPALLAINMGSIILFSAPWIVHPILHEVIADPLRSAIHIRGFMVLLTFALGLGTLVFSPTWFLTDAGIMYSNIEKDAGTDRPVEARTVGGRLTDFLRGYAGIGGILSYLQLVFVFFGEMRLIELGRPIDVVVSVLFFLGLPVFIAIAAMPSLIILDMIRAHRIRVVRRIAEKLGITDVMKISFESIRQ